MSCYLNFYAKVKDEDKYLFLTSYSRDSDFFYSFEEELSIPFYYEGELKDNLYKLTSAEIRQIVDSTNDKINIINDKISEYEKHCSVNSLIIEKIAAYKSVLKEKYHFKGNLDFLEAIISDCEKNFNSFEGIYCNIS